VNDFGQISAEIYVVNYSINMHNFATSLNCCFCSTWRKKKTVLCLSSCDRYLWQLFSPV